MYGERGGVVIGVPTLVGVRQDHIGLKRIDQLRDANAQLRESQCGFPVHKIERDQPVLRESRHREGIVQLLAPRLGVGFARTVPVPLSAVEVSRRAIRHLHDPDIRQLAEPRARSDGLVVRMRDNQHRSQPRQVRLI